MLISKTKASFSSCIIYFTRQFGDFSSKCFKLPVLSARNLHPEAKPWKI